MTIKELRIRLGLLSRINIPNLLQSLHGSVVTLKEGHCSITGRLTHHPKDRSYVQTNPNGDGFASSSFKEGDVGRICIHKDMVIIHLEDNNHD